MCIFLSSSFFFRCNQETMSQFTFWYENCLMSGLVHSFRHRCQKIEMGTKCMGIKLRRNEKKVKCPHAYWISINSITKNEWEEKKTETIFDKQRRQQRKRWNTLPYRKIQLYHIKVVCVCVLIVDGARMENECLCPILIGMFSVAIVLLISLLLSHLIELV